MDEYGRISAPTLVVDTAKVRTNVRRMAERARRNGAALRPHLKTHQSATIGRLFKEAGVRAGTVSSAGMAAYFADAGWDDLTIAFPVNLREITAYDDLQQPGTGACSVVGIYPERGEAVVYGGAVHLSKQAQPPSAGRFPGACLRGLTQEHGIVGLPADELSRLRLGELLFVCPVHSCLAAHALRNATIYL
jgi:D-serine deaminase-like pyridoxal phosphate-dependent protein